MKNPTLADYEVSGTVLAYALLVIDMYRRLGEKGLVPEKTATKIIYQSTVIADISLVELGYPSATAASPDTHRALHEARRDLVEEIVMLSDLEDEGIFTRQDVDDIIRGSMLLLELPEYVTRNAAHQARRVLSYFAEERGIKAKKPN